MFYIGCHLSSSKGFFHMGKEALSIRANTFQFFTRNPRGGNAKAIDPEDVKALLSLMEEEKFGPLLAHGSYTLNLASDKEETRAFALRTIKDDLMRMEYLPGNLYNFHPGSHVKQGTDIGIAFIINALNEIITPEMNTTILLETMAGKGSEIGRNFEEIQKIIENITHQEKIGVCLDTCHVFDGGYDIVNQVDRVLEDFDKVIGLKKLKAIHLNDSKNPLNSHKDRHAKIGEGYIGKEALTTFINHPSIPNNIPFLLETPNELSGYAEEIAFLKKVRNF